MLKEAQEQNFHSLCQDIEDLTNEPDPMTSSSVPLPSAPASAPPLAPAPAVKAPSSPCDITNRTTLPCIDHTLRTLHSHRKGLTVLLVLMGVVLLGFVTLLLFKVFSTCRNKRPRNQKYKSVSRYFPFTYERQSADVSIPAVGLPKTGHAERQVLLNDSDEDEL